MARFTLAYSAFLVSLSEIEALRRLALAKERTDPVGLRNDINALCRGAIVLLCSHLEAFIKSLGEIALDSMHAQNVPRAAVALQLYYHISKDVVDQLKDTTEPSKIAEKMFMFLKEDLPYWSQAGPFPQPIPADRFNKGFSNPGHPKIKAYFRRFGYADFDRDLARILRARYLVTINMVDHLVDIRNKIAHGDAGTTKTPSEVKDMSGIIRTYCGATDSAFASWWKNEFCSIR